MAITSNNSITICIVELRHDFVCSTKRFPTLRTFVTSRNPVPISFYVCGKILISVTATHYVAVFAGNFRCLEIVFKQKLYSNHPNVENRTVAKAEGERRTGAMAETNQATLGSSEEDTSDSDVRKSR